MSADKELYYLIKVRLQRCLKSCIKCEFDVYYNNDTIYITFMPNQQFEFTYVEYNILDKMRDGVTAQEITLYAVKQLRKQLNNKIFK